MRALRPLLAIIAVVGLSAASRAAEKVDLTLVLASDVSRSVDTQKFQLQREGYAAAWADARVLDAVRSGPNGKIAVSFIEWSGIGAQKVVIGWTVVHDEASGRKFGDQILEAPRSFADRTSISGAIDFSVSELETAPFEGRRAIDISGDGTNNAGRDVIAARNDALAKGLTINGLVILSERPLAWNPEHTSPPGGLAAYYRDNVIGGPGAFVMVAENFKSFGNALINKLIAEIAQSREPRHARAH